MLCLCKPLAGSCKLKFNSHAFSFKSSSKCISENGLWQWSRALFPSAATSHHNADSNQVTLHLSITNNLVTTKWIAINLSIRMHNFISTIFFNWLHYFEKELSFTLSFEVKCVQWLEAAYINEPLLQPYSDLQNFLS